MSSAPAGDHNATLGGAAHPHPDRLCEREIRSDGRRMTPEDVRRARRVYPEGSLAAAARRLRRAAKLTEEPINLFRGLYPGFVTSDSIDRLGHVPVFYWHSVAPVEFELCLRYLAENGYATITLDELLEHLTREAPVPARSVVLTFDDGLLSVWQYAAPLLRKYGMHATAFVIAGYVADTEKVRPTLDDVWTGRCVLDDLERHTDIGPSGLMTWKELRALAAGGHVAVESHTRYHRCVATSPRISAFCNPALPSRFFDLPLPNGWQERWLRNPPEVPYGLPLYESAPIAVAERVYRDDPDLREACLGYVRAHGGPSFFERPGWRRRLAAVTQQHRGGRGGCVASTTDSAREALVELAEARAIIRGNIPGARVAHLCLPYGAGSKRALELARCAGYESTVWLLNRAGSSGGSAGDPFRISRIKHDWIFRLPGQGRRSVREILWTKAARRAAA